MLPNFTFKGFKAPEMLSPPIESSGIQSSIPEKLSGAGYSA